MNMPHLTITTAQREVVKHVRVTYASIRGIERNVRLGHYTGRNSRATEATLDYRQDTIKRLCEELPAQVITLLEGEHHLAQRIQRSMENFAHVPGYDRPELRARLNTLRKQIRSL